MTTISLLTAYAGLTLAFWIHTLHVMRVRGRSSRPERLWGWEERILIAIVALVASSAWVLLVPIHVIGMAQLAYQRRPRPMGSLLGPWRRARTIASRPG